jgi:hypothetical protein
MNKRLEKHIEKNFDPKLHKLIKELFDFDGIEVMESRVAENSPAVWEMPEGSWFAAFRIGWEDEIAGTPNPRGYSAMAFLAWVINSGMSHHFNIKLVPTGNFGSGGVEYLHFRIEGKDVAPDEVAEKIQNEKRFSYQSLKDYKKGVKQMRKAYEENERLCIVQDDEEK